jgi:hypothetical protein
MPLLSFRLLAVWPAALLPLLPIATASKAHVRQWWAELAVAYACFEAWR